MKSRKLLFQTKTPAARSVFFYGSEMSPERICIRPTSPRRDMNSMPEFRENRDIQEKQEIWESGNSRKSKKSKENQEIQEIGVPNQDSGRPQCFLLRQRDVLRADLHPSDIPAPGPEFDARIPGKPDHPGKAVNLGIRGIREIQEI